jgi:hypothetical protein
VRVHKNKVCKKISKLYKKSLRLKAVMLKMYTSGIGDGSMQVEGQVGRIELWV